MREMNYIVIGVPTYGHPAVVEDVLTNCCETYKACSLSVYYYDSSKDSETEKVVKSYIDKGFEFLHYLRLPSEMGSAKKAELFFSGYEIEKKYDYYWLMKDRVMVESPLLLTLYQSVMLDKPDIVLLDGYGEHTAGSSEMLYDPVDFYRRWGWEVTSMDTTLLKKDTLLDGFEASDYDYPETEAISYFLHYDIVFRRLSKMDKPKMSVLSEPYIKLYSSPKGGPGWINRLFDIWANHWITENEALPSCYDEFKEEVIKGRALPVEIKSEEGLKWLKEKGALREDQLPMILKNWERISDVPKEKLREIAIG